MQLLVKEILVGDDKIIIRHCIALPNTPLCGCAGGCARRRGRKVQSFMPCRSCKATAELQGNRPRAALAVIDATVTAIKRSTWMQRE
jgi:hypothetical protein